MRVYFLLALSFGLAACQPPAQPQADPAPVNKEEESQVIMREAGDPGIETAVAKARKTFPHFWREAASDFNRIIPALDLVVVKMEFADDGAPDESEHMWVGEVTFDGERITGTLMNSPQWLKSVEEGDSVDCKVDELSDWMLVRQGKVFGGYTVHAMRSDMDEAERKAHDAAWGFDFPAVEEEVPVPTPNEEFETNIAKMLGEHLAGNPDAISEAQEGGRTLLHMEALYGRDKTVKILLDAGADSTAKCERGWTPLDYAKVFDWPKVITLLKGK